MATWKEIKEAFDKLGIKDNDIIAYIDLGFLPTEVVISFHPTGPKTKKIDITTLIAVDKNNDGWLEIY